MIDAVYKIKIFLLKLKYDWIKRREHQQLISTPGPTNVDAHACMDLPMYSNVFEFLMSIFLNKTLKYMGKHVYDTYYNI